MIDLQKYFDRIGYSGTPAPDLATLRAMHRAHAFNVPFENLDISRRVRIEVHERINFDKIVTQHRGGFCLELTGTFARALRQIGFRIDVIGCRRRRTLASRRATSFRWRRRRGARHWRAAV